MVPTFVSWGLRFLEDNCTSRVAEGIDLCTHRLHHEKNKLAKGFCLEIVILAMLQTGGFPTRHQYGEVVMVMPVAISDRTAKQDHGVIQQ